MSFLTKSKSTEVQAGTWVIDPAHSVVEFSVRHLMVSKVRGRFKEFEGTVTTDSDSLKSSVTAKIQTASVDTGDEQRDGHLKSGDFFDVENNPTVDFVSTGLASKSGNYVLDGALTISGVTRPVSLDLEFFGVSPDPWGGTRIGFSAVTAISRKDFGVDFQIPLDGGGVVVGDKITISMDIEAVLQA
jgi:polyisoprenoid-binding protein YceI